MRVQMELTVISVFAGCGGSSLGYKKAGYKELLAIDFDKNAVETFKLNFKNVPVWERDITQVKANEILEFCKIKKGQLDILDGSPPCQGFSTSGKRNVNDTRNVLFEQFVRLVNDLQPKVFIMENVSGMIKGKMKGMFIEIMQTLKGLNYNVKCKLLNAKFYEVPQSRERLFFIGIRKDLNVDPTFPEPLKKVITVKEALINVKLSEIVIPSGEILLNYDNIKVGSDLASYYDSLGLKRKYFNVKKININRPSNTITKLFSKGMSGLLHPKEKRFLCINELKRLSSFPDNFILTGTFREQWARVGNAVMPNQMYYIAKHIKEIVFNKI